MKPWTASELTIIKKHYSEYSKDKLLQLLYPRSWTSIYKKAKKINLKQIKNRNNPNWNWSKKELSVLRKIYTHEPRAYILKTFKHKKIKWHHIVRKASMLKLKRANNRHWKEKEINTLIKTYPIASKETISNLFPNRTWNSITLMAKKLNIKINPKYARKRMANLEILLKNDHISYYWIGFLLADGHFYNKKRLKINLSIKDKLHLLKLAKYIKCTSVKEGLTKNYKTKKNYSCIGLSAQNPEVISQLCQNFDIKKNKTENPPNIKTIKNLNPNLLLSLIIGFIDGDGSIVLGKNRTTPNLIVKNHASWLKILTLFKKHIYSTLEVKPMLLKQIKSKINNSGYATFSITDSLVLFKLKKFALNNKLPILKRKWDKIPKYKNRYFNIRKA